MVASIAGVVANEREVHEMDLKEKSKEITMDFEMQVKQVADKVRTLADSIETEEATKNAFIMPFIGDVLGYDVFNPKEVIPEFTADVGLKKSEKVDYALVLDDQIQILIECKKVGAPLSLENASQLYRYFACTKARIGVLTNGQIWNFYMDLDEANKMDSKPFLVLDLLDIDKNLLPELQKLTKPSFDISSIASTAEELKYVSAIKRAVSDEFKMPSDDFVRLLASHVYDGRLTKSAMTKFNPLVEKALKRFLNDQVNDRLTTALGADQKQAEDEAQAQTDTEEDVAEVSEIVTTTEEITAYNIIQAIACSEVSPERVTLRDAKTYCAIFLDDNNRKPIVRLLFNHKQKYIVLFKNAEPLEKTPIEALNEIYKYAGQIREEVQYLLTK